jgi:hypothetical protein
MKLILFFLILTTAVFSSNLSTLYKLYEKQEYDKACNYAFKYAYKKKNKASENYLTLYGLSCLETNNIARVATPMTFLTKSKDARANASYFGTILLQKQLLLQALVDKKPLGELSLPTTNFVLSKVFTLFLKKRYTLKEGIYKLIDRDDKSIEYRLYMKKNKKSSNYMILDIYKNSKFTKRYQYR